MELLLVMALVVAVGVLGAALRRWLRADGYGVQPPPLPRRPWSAGSLPSLPYAGLR